MWSGLVTGQAYNKGLTNKTKNEGWRVDPGGDHLEIGGCQEMK